MAGCSNKHTAEKTVRRYINNYNRLLLSVLMTVFLGQSLFAAASPCVMMGDASNKTSTESMDHHKHTDIGHADNSHANHSAAAAGEANQAETACCESDGYCSMLNCASVFAMPAAALNLVFVPRPQAGATLRFSIPHFSPATPFKPPIPA